MTRKPPPSRPPDPARTKSDDLLTADDLFGDLVDAPAAPRTAAAPGRETRDRSRSGSASGPSPVSGPGSPTAACPKTSRLSSTCWSPGGGKTPARAPGQPEPRRRSRRPRRIRGRCDHDEDEDAACRCGRPHRHEVPGRHAAAQADEDRERCDLDLAAWPRQAIAAPTPGRRPERPNWRDDVYGPYELLDRIAVGGMAEVFKAKRSGVAGFEKILAVKRILPHLSDNKEFVDMFVDEAKMVAGLTHPNIVQIFDLGQIDKSYFIAMEYVHGRDLRTILKRAREKELRLPLDLGLRVASQVCAALEYAHRKKDDRGRALEIVHRDVSPQNILISFEGEVKLTDFGIAKAATKASTPTGGRCGASCST